MWAPVKVDQSQGLTCYWPICFSKNLAIGQFVFRELIIYWGDPTWFAGQKKPSKWRRPVSVHLHSVSRRNRLYCCVIGGMLTVVVRVVVLHRLGIRVRALTVMVTLRQLEFALGPEQTQHGGCQQLSLTLSSTGSKPTMGNVTQETIAYLLMHYVQYLFDIYSQMHMCTCT